MKSIQHHLLISRVWKALSNWYEFHNSLEPLISVWWQIAPPELNIKHIQSRCSLLQNWPLRTLSQKHPPRLLRKVFFVFLQHQSCPKDTFGEWEDGHSKLILSWFVGGSHDFVRFNFFQLLSIWIQLVYSLMIEAHPICGNLDPLTIKLLVVVWMLISQKEKKTYLCLKDSGKIGWMFTLGLGKHSGSIVVYHLPCLSKQNPLLQGSLPCSLETIWSRIYGYKQFIVPFLSAPALNATNKVYSNGPLDLESNTENG